jgi:hypothetical protein
MPQVGSSCPYSGEDVIAVVHAKGQQDRRETYLTRSCVAQLVTAPGRGSYTAIPLGEVSSVAYSHSVPIWALILAILAALAAVGSGIGAANGGGRDQEQLAIVAAVSGGLFLFFLVIFFVGRAQRLLVASSAGRISANLGGAGKVALRDFVRKLHEASQ